MSEVVKLRQIKPLKINDVLPGLLDDEGKPEFEWVDPSTLYIEEKYQRNLTERSVRLIRKIYKDFQWTRFKPPVVSYGEGGKLFVIDGQHTAIAAISHPKIKKIPVMVVNAPSVKERATSFMGHNRDRLNVTSAQMFYSSVAAGDGVAMAAKKALDDTGCTILRFNPPVWVEGQTLAAGTLMELAARKGVAGLSRVLKILLDAKRAPITALEMKAVADLIWGKDWEGKFDDYNLSTVIRSKSAEAWKAWTEANIRKGHAMQMKRALAIAWYRVLPKKRGRVEGSKNKV